MAAVKDKVQRLMKADFTEKTNVTNLGYKNTLKQGVIFSRRLYMYCSHGNKLLWQKTLRRRSQRHSVKFQKYQL